MDVALTITLSRNGEMDEKIEKKTRDDCPMAWASNVMMIVNWNGVMIMLLSRTYNIFINKCLVPLFCALGGSDIFIYRIQKSKITAIGMLLVLPSK